MSRLPSDIILKANPVNFVLSKGSCRNRVSLLSFLDRRRFPEFRIELESLLKLQREDGSWPFDANIGYPSSVLETAWSLEALADAGETESKVIKKAANWLFGQQKERGSWAEVKDLKGLASWWMTPGRSSHATTSDVVAALSRQGFRKDDERVSLALEYLRARQFRAGGWGWRFPHAWGTVSVLRAFALAGEGEDSPVVKRGLDFMLFNRDRYGFWWGPGATSLFMHVYLLLGYMLDDQLLQRCIIYLVRNQNDDGGWGWRFKGPSDASITTSIVSLMKRYGLLEQFLK